MKKEQIHGLFRQFENICYLYNQVECWSARELQKLLGYSKWENFEKSLTRLKIPVPMQASWRNIIFLMSGR